MVVAEGGELIMSGLKRDVPGLRFTSTAGASNPTPTLAVTPDEIDRYEVYTVINPATLNVNQWFGTFPVGGTSSLGTMVVVNAISDYPRNLEFSVTGTGAGMAGTLTATGRDQFGSVIQEVISIGTASNGGTQPGTKVFAQITNGTINFGTAVGNGTARVGLGTTGTTTLFGLPFKVGGTTDLKLLSVVAGTGGVSVNGGTIAAFINVPQSAILAPVTTTGTMTITAWVRPTFNSENIPLVANLPQRT